MDLTGEGASFAAQVTDTDFADEMRDAFVPYALAVMTARVIPDARDGLKPVQRRILTAMHRMGLSSDSAHTKSASVVGEVMGKYHPHGDQAIYEAMVRLGQRFTQPVTFVDPKGNFGGIDDPPAAARYTEARLTGAAASMLAGLDEDAVDALDTFDSKRTEPSVLPAALPSLLVNGATGIAVGVATEIPPHNLGEVASAVREHLSRKPGTTPRLSTLLKHVTGPDFPSGGVLVDTSDAHEEMYRTGRGRATLRAAHREERQGSTTLLVFEELPFRVGPERVVAEAARAADKNRLPLVAVMRDESDRRGTRLVAELTRGADSDAALTQLRKHTSLEVSVNAQMVALVDGVPQQIGLVEIVKVYAEHLVDVTRRRTEHRLAATRRRAHIVRGLLAAVDKIDQTVKTIRRANSSADASTKLQKLLSIDEEQAAAVLDMRLRRLTKLNATELADEMHTLTNVIADCEAILGSDRALRSAASDTLDAACADLVVPRRTAILRDGELLSVDAAVAWHADGRVTRDRPSDADLLRAHVPADRSPHVVTSTASASAVRSNDDVDDVAAVVPADGVLVAATSQGRCFVAASAVGIAAKLHGNLNDDERVVGVADCRDADAVVFVSRSGYATRRSLESLPPAGKRVVQAMNLSDDELAAVLPCRPDAKLLLRADGRAVAASFDDIPITQRPARGVMMLPKSADAALVSDAVAGERVALRDADAGLVEPDVTARRKWLPESNVTEIGVLSA